MEIYEYYFRLYYINTIPYEFVFKSFTRGMIGLDTKTIMELILLTKILDNPIWVPVLVSNLLLLPLALGILLFFLAKPISRYYVNKISDYNLSRLLSEQYSHNITEILTSFKRITVQNVIELNLRAQNGKTIDDRF